jgi:hypothetical protein
VTAAEPGYDEVVLTAPDGSRLCNSLACSRAGTLAEVIVTCGVLSDPGASYHSREALWRESWGVPVPMCATCWDSCRQVAIKYRPGLAVIDATGSLAAPQPSGERA